MTVPMWVTAVVLASSLSLIVTLIQRWRRRLRVDARDEAERAAAAAEAQRRGPAPPFSRVAPATTRTPPYKLILPPDGNAGLLAWWQRLEGTTTFWLCRGAGVGGWWVTWFSPWRRGLPERLRVGRDVPTDWDGHVALGPGLHAAWRGDAATPALLDDAAIWQEASLCGLTFELVRLADGIGLHATERQIRDRFDLGSLASLAALIEARIGDHVAPQTWDIAAVQLRMAAPPPTDPAAAAAAAVAPVAQVAWGDLPPFGGISHVGDQWRFEARGARTDEGAMLDLWPHGAAFVPLRTNESGVLVQLADGTEAEIRALDGRQQQLGERLGLPQPSVD